MENSKKLNILFFILIILTLNSINCKVAFATSTSWKGITSTSWATSTNWTNGVPSSTVDAVIGDASFTGAYQPSISATSTVYNLTIGNGSIASTLTTTKKLTVSGSLLIGSNGTLAFNSTSTSSALTVKINFTNNGSFTTTSNSATFKMGGTTQTLGGTSTTSFRRLTINSGSTTTLTQNITVTYNLTVTGTLDPSEPAKTVTITGTTFTLSSNSVLYVKGSTFTSNYSIVPSSVSATSIIDYAASTINQTVNSSITYGILRISGGMTKSLAANLPNLSSSSSSGGKLYVNGGTFDIGAYTANRNASGGSFTVANGATLKIGGTNTFPSNYSTHTIGASSTIEYSGTNQTVSNETYGNLKLSSSSGAAVKTMPSASLTISGLFRTNVGSGTSVSVTAAGALTIGNGLTIGSSTTFIASTYSHTITGNVQNDGTLTGSTSTITLNGASSTISGAGTTNFYNLTITAAGITVSNSMNINVDGNLATTGSGAITHSSGGTGTLTMAGTTKTISGSSINLNNVTISGSVSTSSNLSIAGDLTVNGTFTNTTNTLTLSGSSKTISGSGTETVSALVVSGTYTTTKTFSISADLTVSGSLTASSGTITFNGTSALSGTANLYNITVNGTSLTMGGSSSLGIANSFTITSGTFNTTSNTPNTVTFNGSGAQSVNAITYYKLILSTSGTKTAAGAITLNGNFQIDASVTFAAGSYTHSFTRDFTNNGTFTAGTSTSSFTGTIDAAISGATTFNIITINKSATSNVVTMSSSCTAITANMTSGEIHTGSNTLTLTSGRTGTGIILGIITRTHSYTTGVDYEFEGPYNTLNFSSVSGVTSVTVTALNAPVGDYPFGGSVNREYVFAVPSGTYTASIKLHYNDVDINGNVESTMNIWKFVSGTTWLDSSKTSNSTTNNYIQKDGLTNIVGRWTMSDDVNALQWTGAISTAWNNSANWTAIAGSPNNPPSSTDIVELGSGSFTNQPEITTAVTVRGITFNSPTPVTVTISTGGSLTSNGNLNGNIAGNYSLGAATHNFNVGAQTMNVGGSLVLSDGTNGHSININIGTGTVTVSGSLVQSGNANVAFSGAGLLNISSDYTYTSGTFTCSTGTVNYNGSGAQVVAPLTYYNLSLDKTAGVATSSLPVRVGNNLTLSTAAFYQTNDSLIITGNTTINSGTTLKGNTANILVGGNWVNSGTFTPSSSTVILNGTGSQSISTTTFNNLTINKSAGTATPGGNLTINGNLTITNGTVDLGTYTANRSATGGTFSLSNSSQIKIAGASNFPSSYTTNTLSSSSTVEYNGTVSQTVNAITYGHLTFTNSGTKTLSGTTAVSGNLLINSGSTFSASSYALSAAGNWTNSGTFTCATSTVTLSGSTKTLTGATTFNVLNVSGSYTSANNIIVNSATTLSGTFAAGSNNVTMTGNFTCTGTLSSSGTITFSGTGAQALQLNSGLSTTGTVNFNGTVTPTITSTTAPTFNILNLNNTGGITPVSDWRVNGAATIASSVTFSGGANTFTFYSSFTNNGTVTSSDTFIFYPTSSVTVDLMGTAFTSTGCLNFGGSGAIALTGTPTSIENVLISNSNASGVTLQSSWTINGNMTVMTGSTFNGGTALALTINGTLDCNGTLDGGTSTITLNGTTEEILGTGDIAFYNLIIASASTITSSTDFQIKKDFTNNGTFDATAYSVEFTGALASSISGSTTPTTIDILTITKTSATVTVSVNLSTLTQITINSGTLDVSNKTISQDVAGGDLDIQSGATLKVGGSNNIPTFATYNINANGTVEFNGSNQAISSTPNYGNIVFSAAGNKTPAGALSISGNFTLSAGTFIGGNYTHALAGNWTMSGGTFTNSNTTINFNGTASQAISSTGSFNNVTVNKSSGSLTLSTDASINGTLTFTSGNITTGSYKVILPSGAAVSRTSGHVVGYMQKYFSSTASKTFEIGDATYYAPVAIAFSSISVNGSLIASTTNGDHSDITNSSVDVSKSVNRFYTLTNSGISFTNYSATFNFNAGDIDAGATTSNFIVANRPSSTWTFPTVGTKTSTSTQCTGNTTFGDFQVGEYGQKVWDGGASTTNWGDANNWNPNGVPSTTENVVLNGANTITISVAAVCRDLTISNSSLSLTINATYSLAASGNFSMSAGTLNTAASFPTVTGTTTFTGGTIGYTLGGAQTIATKNYYNLTISTSGTKTFAAGTTGIANTLTVSGTATFNASTNSATVSINGTTAQTITTGGSSFYNITISNASGVTLADNCTVSNVLSLSSGNITTGSYRIICTSTASGAVTNHSSSSYIFGNLRRYIANNTSTYAFPVGTASAYTLEELINNNLSGITYIDASFGAKPGTDAGINVWENGTYYTSVNSFGVWYLTPNSSPSSGTYDLKCYLNAFSGLADNSFSILSRPDASSNGVDWGKAGGTLNSNGGVGRLVSDGYALRKALTSFSQKGIGQTGMPLPVTLTSFDANRVGNNVQLNWITSAEEATDKYEIEVAIDNNSFVKIGEVKAAGTSVSELHYEFIDYNIQINGTRYYRLKIVNTDNSFSYSPIRKVVIENNSPEIISVYPNPSSGLFQLQTNFNYTQISVYDITGKKVFSSNENISVINLMQQHPGIYFMELSNGHEKRNFTLQVE